MAPMFPVSQHHLIIQNKVGANVSSFPASPENNPKDGANVGSFVASPDQTTKMAPMLAVAQHHLIIQNKVGANVSSFPASPDHTKQRWRQSWQFRSIT
jgi:hypothetical protein